MFWQDRVHVPPPLISTFGGITQPDPERMLSRALGIFLIVALVLEPRNEFRHSLEKARQWVATHGCSPVFSDDEMCVWEGDPAMARRARPRFVDRVEALHALCWARGLVDELTIVRHVPDSLGDNFPDVLAGESPVMLRNRVECRPLEEIVSELDLYLCAHWLLREVSLSGADVAPLQGYIVIERRRALQWACSNEDWDEVELDT